MIDFFTDEEMETEVQRDQVTCHITNILLIIVRIPESNSRTYTQPFYLFANTDLILILGIDKPDGNCPGQPFKLCT